MMRMRMIILSLIFTFYAAAHVPCTHNAVCLLYFSASRLFVDYAFGALLLLAYFDKTCATYFFLKKHNKQTNEIIMVNTNFTVESKYPTNLFTLSTIIKQWHSVFQLNFICILKIMLFIYYTHRLYRIIIIQCQYTHFRWI